MPRCHTTFSSFLDIPGSWCVLAPLLEQKEQTQTKDINHYLYTVESFGVFNKLASLRIPESRYSQLSVLKHLGSANINKPSVLESLPNELFDQILCDTTLGPQDIVNFGVCSKRIWARVLHHIQNTTPIAPWANTPLICPSSRISDFPPAMYEFFPQVKVQQDAFDRDTTGQAFFPPVSRWVERAFETFANVQDANIQRQCWLEAISSPLITYSMPPQVHLALRSTLEDALRLEVPLPREKWALRNLTTNEYVRLEVVHAKDIIAYVETATPWLPLDIALLIQIIWYSPGTVNSPRFIPSLGAYKRGVWAAHRFDVVRIVEVNPEGAWKDATESVVKQAWSLQLHHWRKPDLRPQREIDQERAFKKRLVECLKRSESNSERSESSLKRRHM